jgi:hypothetical protein
MGRLEKFEALFDQANRSPVPMFHVSDRVLAEIAMREAIPLSPLSWVAGISAAAAAIALFFAVQGWMAVSSSMVNYFDPAVLDFLL